MKSQSVYLLAILLLFISCEKNTSLPQEPTPSKARIQFLHFYTVQPIKDLLIIRNEITGANPRFLDSLRTDKNGFTELSYPDTSIYKLSVSSEKYLKPVYLMYPARNTGLITLIETEFDFPAKYMGTHEGMHQFRIFLF